MTAARKYTLIWILLPLLALRGLVPAGYMFDTSGGDLLIVMCGGSGPLIAATNEHSGHMMVQGQMDHDHHGPHSAGHADQQGSEHDKHKNSLCPFAIAGSAATLVSIPSVPAGIEPVRIVAAADAVALHGLSGPSRTQQSRAPPSFSVVS